MGSIFSTRLKPATEGLASGEAGLGRFDITFGNMKASHCIRSTICLWPTKSAAPRLLRAQHFSPDFLCRSPSARSFRAQLRPPTGLSEVASIWPELYSTPWKLSGSSPIPSFPEQKIKDLNYALTGHPAHGHKHSYPLFRKEALTELE